METNEELIKYVETEIKKDYPYILASERKDAFGMIIGSKIEGEFKEIASKGSMISLTLDINGRQAEIIGFHPAAPINNVLAQWREDDTIALLTHINKENQRHQENSNYHLGEYYPRPNRIVLGDFNMTPWTPFFKDIIRQTDLKEARRGFGIETTWNSGNDLSGLIFSIPIDHILTSQSIQTIDFRTIKGKGSDHRAVVGELSVDN